MWRWAEKYEGKHQVVAQAGSAPHQALPLPFCSLLPFTPYFTWSPNSSAQRRVSASKQQGFVARDGEAVAQRIWVGHRIRKLKSLEFRVKTTGSASGGSQEEVTACLHIFVS
jgi:hypothetical protein